jgi:protein tyrosine phosphatase (PTP) superfamily phosphohydrolase (DUF442 family)
MRFRLKNEKDAREETMQANKISGELPAGPQIIPGGIAGLAAAGVRAIICNRPEWLAKPKS